MVCTGDSSSFLKPAFPTFPDSQRLSDLNPALPLRNDARGGRGGKTSHYPCNLSFTEQETETQEDGADLAQAEKREDCSWGWGLHQSLPMPSGPGAL